MSHPNDRKVKIVSNVKNLRNFNLKSIKASLVIPRSQPWLWEPYIPLETCTLFAGKGGLGKSQLLLHIAGLVSNGSKFSINSLNYSVEQGHVLILSAEDSVESSIVPRLKAVGANLENIDILISTIDEEMPDFERFIALDNDIILLENIIKQKGNVKLIVIDPITAYLGKIKENQSCEVRSFILKLSRLAEKYKLAIVLNTHTRKKGAGESHSTATDEIMGSSAWVNTVRQVFTISSDHEDPSRILFINCKSNCGASPESFDYKIEGIDLTHGNEIIKTCRIKLLSGKVTVSADEALNKDIYEKKLAIDDAKELILRELSFGNRTTEQMRAAADKASISEITLKRARQELTKSGIPIIMEQSQTDKRKMIWYIGSDKK